MIRKVFAIASLSAAMITISNAQWALLVNDAQGRSYPEFHVNDPWTLTVSGGASLPVTIHAVHNGNDLGTSYLGETNSGGVLTLPGSMPEWATGHWVETIYVNGQAAPQLEFTVSSPKPCIFWPAGHQYLSNMTSWDVWSNGSVHVTKSWQPQHVTHSVINGPCHATWAYAWTYFLDAEHERDHDSVEWVLEDGERTGPATPRRDPSGPNGYNIYESGSIHSLFEHDDTHDTYLVSSYYWLTIYGCLDSMWYCLPF